MLTGHAVRRLRRCGDVKVYRPSVRERAGRQVPARCHGDVEYAAVLAATRVRLALLRSGVVPPLRRVDRRLHPAAVVDAQDTLARAARPARRADGRHPQPLGPPAAAAAAGVGHQHVTLRTD